MHKHMYLKSVRFSQFIHSCQVCQRLVLSIGMVFQEGKNRDDSLRSNQQFQFFCLRYLCLLNVLWQYASYILPKLRKLGNSSIL